MGEEPFQHLDDQGGVVSAEIHGLADGLIQRERQVAVGGRDGCKAELPFGIEFGRVGSHVKHFAVAQHSELNRLALPGLHVGEQRVGGVESVTVHGCNGITGAQEMCIRDRNDSIGLWKLVKML